MASKKKQERLVTLIQCLVTEEEGKLIEACAKLDGRTISSWVRSQILPAIAHVRGLNLGDLGLDE